MPSSPSELEALAALERLLRRNVVTLEQAQAAARLITGDPATVFPPPPAQGQNGTTPAEGAPGGP